MVSFILPGAAANNPIRCTVNDKARTVPGFVTKIEF